MFNAILLVVFLWALVLRVLLLDASIDYDEAYSFLTYMSRDFLTCISQYNISNNHILNSYIGWTVQQLFSAEPAFLRAPALLMGVASVYAIFLGLKSFFDTRTAWLASLLTWASFPHIIYSSLARGYIYQIFFVYLGVHFLNQRRWAAAVICWSLALWALPTSLYPLFIFGLAFVYLQHIQWIQWLRFLIFSGVLTGFLYLPALIYVFLFGTKTFFASESLSWNFVSSSLAKTWSFLWLPSWGGWLIFIALLIYAFRGNLGREKTFFKFMVAAVCLIPFLNKTILGYERFWMWLLPVMAAFIVKFTETLPKSERFAKIYFLLLMILMVGINSDRVMDFQIRESSNRQTLYLDLQEQMQPGDFLLISQSTVTLLNYWDVVTQRRDLRELQPFFISGDWYYSLYRTRASDEILREKVGSNRFWALIESDRDLESAQKLLDSFVGRPMEYSYVDLPHYKAARIVEFKFKL